MGGEAEAVSDWIEPIESELPMLTLRLNANPHAPNDPGNDCF